MKFDRRLLFNFDWILLFLAFSLCGIGLLNLYSAGSSLGVKGEPIYFKQFIWFIVGIGFMILSFTVDYRTIVRHAYLIYAFSFVMLIVLFFTGEVMRGTQRWLVIGGLSFQPSELMKLALILALTKFFSAHEAGTRYDLKKLIVPCLMMLVPFLLILKQPDLGTAMVLFIIFVSMVLFVGVKWRSIILVAVTGMLMAPVCWTLLKDYQRERILTFLNPERDPLGSGYHIIQSIIAVGSGGMIGKGYLKGTQSQLRFLPEHQTDFIFSVFAEEWGFVGGFVLLFLFLSFIFWGLRVARYSRDCLGSILAFGIMMLFFWEVFINIGMVLGLLPVVGIPLPFFSYGGSALVILMSAVGLLINISMRRYILQP